MWARWVPRSLTDCKNAARPEMCSDLTLQLQGWWWKLCVTGSSLGRETRTHYIEPQTNSLWNGIIQLILGRRSFSLTLQQGKSWLCFFFFCDTERVISVYTVPSCHAIVLDLHIQTLKTLQICFRRVQPHINHLKTKRRLHYLKTPSVPRSKHFSSQL